MHMKKRRLLLSGISAVAVSSAGVLAAVQAAYVPPAYAAPAGEIAAMGEGGEAEGVAIADEAAIAFAFGLRQLEADLNAGHAAANSGDMKAATAHFQAVHDRLNSDQGNAMEEEGLDRAHMSDEILGLIMVSADATGPDDVRDLYEHGLHEVDEHIMAIEPLMRRSVAYAVQLTVHTLTEAGAQLRAARQDGGDAASARRATALARIARNEMGAVAAQLIEADAARAAQALELLNSIVDLTEEPQADVGEVLSTISRFELITSAFQ